MQLGYNNILFPLAEAVGSTEWSGNLVLSEMKLMCYLRLDTAGDYTKHHVNNGKETW